MPIKRQRWAEWIKIENINQLLTMHCLQKTHFKFKDTNQLKVKWCKRIYCTNNNRKRTGMATLISSKIDFKTKIFTRHQQERFMTREWINQ